VFDSGFQVLWFWFINGERTMFKIVWFFISFLTILKGNCGIFRRLAIVYLLAIFGSGSLSIHLEDTLNNLRVILKNLICPNLGTF
jgi:hypothetical protein